MKEQRKVIKLFFSFKKEEAWLDSMSVQGWHLNNTPGLFYTFKKGKPEKRIHKIDFQHFKRSEDFHEYIEIFKDSGWYCIDPHKSGNNYYFYTISEDSQKDIFSDETSRAQHYLRYARNLMYTMFICFVPYLGLYASGTFKVKKISYLTPGLWEMQGMEFIKHFFFETPFVIFRLVGSYLPLILMIGALLYALKGYMDYQRNLKQMS